MTDTPAAPLHVTAPFVLTREDLAEGMKLATAVKVARAERVENLIATALQLLLAPLGAAMLYVLLAGADPFPFALPFWPVIVIFLIVALSGPILANRAEARALSESLQSRFFATNRVEIGTGGVTFCGPDSRWRIGWADIDALCRGRQVIMLRVALMYFPVPMAAFRDKDAADSAWRRMQELHAKARR